MNGWIILMMMLIQARGWDDHQIQFNGSQNIDQQMYGQIYDKFNTSLGQIEYELDILPETTDKQQLYTRIEDNIQNIRLERDQSINRGNMNDFTLQSIDERIKEIERKTKQYGWRYSLTDNKQIAKQQVV